MKGEKTVLQGERGRREAGGGESAWSTLPGHEVGRSCVGGG